MSISPPTSDNVLPSGTWIDISPHTEQSLRKDLGARDFTVNAIAMNLQTGELYDPYNGVNDIEQRVIRVVSEESLRNDPVRIIRAIRFSFTPETRDAVAENKLLLQYAPSERVGQELLKMLSFKNASHAFSLMNDLDVLRYVLPALQQCVGVAQNDYHHLDVFEHSLILIDLLPINFDKIISLLDSAIAEKVKALYV